MIYYNLIYYIIISDEDQEHEALQGSGWTDENYADKWPAVAFGHGRDDCCRFRSGAARS